MALSHFCLHYDMQETMAELSDEEAGAVIKALLAYCNGLEPEPLTGAARIVYGILRRQHDRDVETYTAKAAKLSANGALGGRPRKANANEENQTKPNETTKKQMVFFETKKSQEEEEEEDKRKRMRMSIDSPEPSKASGPPVARIPLNDGTYHVIYQSDIDHYKELYPAVDIMAELRKMIGWCEDNKAKRKTKRGVARFIGSWLSREQDRGGRTASAPRGKIVTESQYTQRPNTEPDGDDVPQWLRDRRAQNPA